MAQYGFLFDQSRCTGCMACAVACKSWNQLPPGPVKWLRVMQLETGAFPNVRIPSFFVPCFHCANPVCVDAAKGSIYKENQFGAVLIDPQKANDPGIKAAWQACPYGCIAFDSDAPDSNASKCTMCIDRLQQNLLPACVVACPMRALDFGPIEQLSAKYKDASLELANMPPSSTTTPAVFFKQMADKKTVVPYDAARALTLMASRAPLPAIYSDPSQVTNIPAGVVGHSTLVLKPKSGAEFLRNSQSEDG